jgi:hypothetical protein
VGVRSHRRPRSRLRPVARVLPGPATRRRWIRLLHRTAVGPRRPPLNGRLGLISPSGSSAPG